MRLRAELSPAGPVEEVKEWLHDWVKPARRATSAPPRCMHDIAGPATTHVTHAVGGFA